MKNDSKRIWSRATAMAFGSAIALAGTFGAAAASGISARTLSAGTVLPVKLESELSSNNSRRGDKFTARIESRSGGAYYGLPSGSRVEGVVRSVRPRRDKTPGMLDLDFTRLTLPGGQSYKINGGLISLDKKSVTDSADGRIVAKKQKKTDRLTYVGYGAGGGLLVGLLRGRPLEDALVGAGLGYLYGSVEKSKPQPRDVLLKEGTAMGVRLDRSVTIR